MFSLYHNYTNNNTETMTEDTHGLNIYALNINRS